MSNRIRPSKDNKSWEYDIHIRLPDGTKIRERRKLRISSRVMAQHWARMREEHLLRQGLYGTPIPSTPPGGEP